MTLVTLIEEQGIKVLQSLISNHDLDCFIHDHELIMITKGNDCYPFNFFSSHLDQVKDWEVFICSI